MNRREFIKICSLLGIPFSFQKVRANLNNQIPGFSESVLIIGAGAAGMSAAYLLANKGIKYKILEASSTFGGRMKRSTSFANFPIALGAEWLHVSKKELATITNHSINDVAGQLKGYSGQEKVGYYEEGELSYVTLTEAFGEGFSDQKFINSSWLDFFAQYVVPTIHNNMLFNAQISSITYVGDHFIVTDKHGVNYSADRVILTVPLKVLKNNAISFNPALPNYKVDAINSAPVWGGLKVFLEFTEKFYPTYLAFPDSETVQGQRLYFDAAYAQNTSSNILGLFAIGKQAKPYQSKSDKNQLNYILRELDNIFEGKASRNYKKHIVQDWDKEPFIQSAYLADIAPPHISSDLFTPIEDLLFFAGEAYTSNDDWGGVHNAIRSARDVIQRIISS